MQIYYVRNSLDKEILKKMSLNNEVPATTSSMSMTNRRYMQPLTPKGAICLFKNL